MRLKSFVLFLTVLLLFFGCKTWPKVTPKSSLKFYATGSANMSDPSKSEVIAETRARASIAAQIKSTIKQATIDYIQESGIVKKDQIDSLNFIENITLQLVNIDVPYSKIEKKKIDKDGTTYILLSVNKNEIKSEFRKKAKALEKDKKLISKYKTDEALPYLEKLMEKE